MIVMKNKNKAAVTIADKINSRFNNSESNFITLKDRLSGAIKTEYNHINLADSKEEFKRRNEDLISFDDIRLCEATTVVLSDILIDTTIQRDLSTYWVAHIIRNFVNIKANPISVYRNDAGALVCWDGQHTAIALSIIANDIFGEDNALVPVNIFPANSKEEMRKAFISHATGVDSKTMELYDIMCQHIYGVRTDRSNDSVWIDTELKQQQLEKYGLFLAAEKSDEAGWAGAISRMTEIEKYGPEIAGYFGQYFHLLCNSNRAVNGLDVQSMYNIFTGYKQAGITIDTALINDIVSVFKKLGVDKKERLYSLSSKARFAHESWYVSSLNPTATGIVNKDGSMSTTGIRHTNRLEVFLCAHLLKENVVAPSFWGSCNNWIPSSSDLLC